MRSQKTSFVPLLLLMAKWFLGPPSNRSVLLRGDRWFNSLIFCAWLSLLLHLMLPPAWWPELKLWILHYHHSIVCSASCNVHLLAYGRNELSETAETTKARLPDTRRDGKDCKATSLGWSLAAQPTRDHHRVIAWRCASPFWSSRRLRFRLAAWLARFWRTTAPAPLFQRVLESPVLRSSGRLYSSATRLHLMLLILSLQFSTLIAVSSASRSAQKPKRFLARRSAGFL